MKFTARVRGLLDGLEPVITVATKSAVKEYKSANFITLNASEDGITASADGGRMSITNSLDALNQSVLGYNCVQPGSITVRAFDVRRVLQSFNEDDEISFEVKQSSEGTKIEENTEQNEEMTPAQYAMLDSGHEVVCTLISDTEEMQTMPCSTVLISPSLIEPLKSSPINIRRDVFVASASKISFAHGFQDFRKEYLYWVLRLDKGHVRFVAGSGGRFAILDTYADADVLTNASKKQDILIPNHVTAALIDVFSKNDNDYLTFQTGERQISISSGSANVIISQIEPDVKWPDENVILNRSNKIKIVTRVGNWLNAIKGISATNSEEIKKQGQIHTASISFDPKSKMIHAKSNDQLKSHRKISVDDAWTDDSNASDIVLRCASKYLTEAIKNGDNDAYMQMEIDGENRPIVVRYHSSDKISKPNECKKVNEALGVTEQYSFFFAPQSKK